MVEQPDLILRKNEDICLRFFIIIGLRPEASGA